MYILHRLLDSTEGQSDEVLRDKSAEVLHDKSTEVSHDEPAEVLVDSTDTSFNRRDGKNTHVENTSTGYALALGDHNDAVTSAESNTGEKVNLKLQGLSLQLMIQKVKFYMMNLQSLKMRK